MQAIQIPTHCPACESTLHLIKDQLFCKNVSCPAQLNKKLEQFVTVLKIKGLGPKSLEKLDLQDITELFYLDPSDLASALGSDKLAEKLHAEIDKARHADLATVLASMSIPLVGETASNKIASVVSHIDEITEETCKEAGLGAKVTENLLTWLHTDFVEMREYLPFSFRSSRTVKISADAESICITGKLTSFKTKSEATALLEAAGFKVVDSVTKTTKYLVDEGDKGSTKRKKAEELGIHIITNLKDFLKEHTHD